MGKGGHFKAELNAGLAFLQLIVAANNCSCPSLFQAAFFVGHRFWYLHLERSTEQTNEVGSSYLQQMYK